MWTRQATGWTFTVIPAPVMPYTPVPTSLFVGPSPVTVPQGQTGQLTAAVFDQIGASIPGEPVSFLSQNSGIATVTSGGLVTGISGGNVGILAQSGSLTALATVTVTPPSGVPILNSILVTPATASVQVGSTTTPTAAGFDQFSSSFAITPVWASNNALIASVNASTGVITGVSGGTVVISASQGGIVGTTTITVRQVTTVVVTPATATITSSGAGQTVQLVAVGNDQFGAPMTGLTFAWVSGTPAHATVNASTGLVTGVGAGTVNITASTLGIQGFSLVTVGSPASPVLTTIKVSPSAASIQITGTQSYSAAGFDQNGQPFSTTFTWTSLQTSIATVNSSTGLATGVAQGIATIKATSGSINGTASCTVLPPPTPTTVVLAPASVTIAQGTTQQETATTYDQNNNVMAGRSYTWSSSNTSIATVTSSGLVNGVAQGTVQITATETTSGVQGHASITVSPRTAQIQSFGAHADVTFDVGNTSLQNQAITKLKSMHGIIMRNSLLWDHIENTNGTFVWGDHDNVVNGCISAGLTNQLIVVGSPNWANSGSDKYVVPGTSVTDSAFTTWVSNYVTWITTAATRYKGKCTRWELWNEEDQGFFWKPTPNPVMYAYWANAIQNALLAVDPTNIVCFGGLAGLTAGPVYPYGSTGIQFYNQVCSAGFLAKGAVAAHPYSNGAPNVNVSGQDSFTDIAKLYSAMQAQGQGNLPMWLTEWGWASGGSNSDSTIAGWVTTSLNMIATQYPYVTIAEYFQEFDTASFPYGLYNSSFSLKAQGTAAQTFFINQGQ